MTSYPPPPGEQPAPGQYPPPAAGQAPSPGAVPANPYASGQTVVTPTGPATPVAPFWTGAFVVLAVASIVVLILPWFHPVIGSRKIPGISDLHSWNGVIFFVVPVLMVIAAFRAVKDRTNLNEFRRTSLMAVISGALMLVSAAWSYAGVPGHYKDWDQAKEIAKQSGLTLGRGPLIGWYLALIVGVIMIVVGAAGLIQSKRNRPA